jgi:hypothetical protein
MIINFITNVSHKEAVYNCVKYYHASLRMYSEAKIVRNHNRLADYENKAKTIPSCLHAALRHYGESASQNIAFLDYIV